MVSKWYLFVSKVSNLRKIAEGTMVLHYSALVKIPHFDEIIYYSIIQSYVMTDPLCHDLSTIHKLMLALLPSRKFSCFCTYKLDIIGNWYLFSRLIVSKRYLFQFFLVSIWYLLDTKWNLDTWLHPCIGLSSVADSEQVSPGLIV